MQSADPFVPALPVPESTPTPVPNGSLVPYLTTSDSWLYFGNCPHANPVQL